MASFLLLSFHLGIPTDWCLENVAKLLKLCGESVCFEVLGNKAVNGRVHELSYLGYYLGQVCISSLLVNAVSFLVMLVAVLTAIPGYSNQSTGQVTG